MLAAMLLLMTFAAVTALAQTPEPPGGEAALGSRSYDDYEKPQACVQCHEDIYRQWEQAMMSKAYTHKWDEVEYFDLAVAHGEKVEKFKPVSDGCNGCHAPLAFLAGDVSPPKPGNSRADESVSCEICHTAVGSVENDPPFNFSWQSIPGREKLGPRTAEEAVQSPHHDMVHGEFATSPELCGSCHNEKDPWGVWVKSTHIEWKEGPYYEEGVVCMDCHMTYAPHKTAKMGNEYPDAAQHLFHGAHDPGKVQGTIELRIHPDVREAEMGMPVNLTLALFNQKTGHKFPTGSVEDRIVWVHVEAVDESGKVYPLKVNPKGFEGEEYTIGSDDLAYQDMAVPLDKPAFEGVRRDGEAAVGDRIFRMPYFDEEGRMTIMQWNTASLGVDYRLGPRETKLETYTFEIPYDITPGEVTVTATMYYSKLVKSVADLLGVPEEAEPIVVNEHSTTFEVF
jgi:hypothetical protein